MKGTSPSKADKLLWGRMAALGCIACREDGVQNQYVSIHHIDGRSKAGAHSRVLPLCFWHHQSGDQEAPSVHPWKARFEAKYGKQADLLAEVIEALE